MNQLHCWRVSHRTAPIEARERCAVPSAEARAAVRAAAMRRPEIQGCLLLSTCNRTELYFSVQGDVAVQDALLLRWVAELLDVKADELESASRLLSGKAVPGHLSRVASGMDSGILGEAEVFGQVREAWKESREQGAVDEHLQRMVQAAIVTARKIRSQTEIGVGSVSVPSVAARYYRKLFSRPEALTAVIVGSGKVAQLVAQHLSKENIGQIIIVGRNAEAVAALAAEVGAGAQSLPQLEMALLQADILVGTSASVQPVVSASMVKRALASRNYKPQLLLDLAMPRDIAADAGQFSDAYLVNLDQLSALAESELQRRRQAVAQAEELVSEGEDSFAKSLLALRSAQLVSEYRKRVQDDADRELAELQRLLAKGELTEAVLQKNMRALSRRMMHPPTLWLREIGQGEPEALLQRFTELLTQTEEVPPD